VQGVFFRASTRERALALGLTGHAINLDDGCVEVLACGDETAIEALRQWLHQGPPAAKVQAVESEPLPAADEPPTGFTTG
jgi:acylphosphatase